MGVGKDLASPMDRPGIRLVETWLARAVGEKVPEKVGQPIEAAQILHGLIGEADREHFVVLFLNSRAEVTHAHLVSRGSASTTVVHPREVFKAAVLANAGSVIVGHNHPSGDVSPSAEDRATARRLEKAGEILGIPVLDSLIVGPSDRFYAESIEGMDSLRQAGMGLP